MSAKVNQRSACGQGFDEDGNAVGRSVPSCHCADGKHEGPIVRLTPGSAGAPPSPTEMALLVEKVARLEKRITMSVEERLSFWSNAVPGSSGKHSAASKFCEATYNKTCVFCGVNDSMSLPVTNAHIVTSGCSSYDVFGPPQYKDVLDVKSPRNFLPLCGTLGRYPGSCHDLFEKYLLTLLYNPFARTYQVWSLRENEKLDVDGNPLHEKVLALHHEPYRRLLAWRTRKCISEHGYLLPDGGERLLLASNFSEESRSIASMTETATDEGSSDIGGAR